MPATVKTEESFPNGVSETQIKEEKSLRLRAGAIRCEYTGSVEDGWKLTTEWNVIGEM